MNIIRATNARLSIQRADGTWHDCGEAGLATTEMEEPAAFTLPRVFEITRTVTWQRWAPFALSLPPAGSMPMWN